MLSTYRLKAFTLVECLVALLVLTGSIQVYQGMTKLVSAHVHHISQHRETDWLLFCQQFRAELETAKLIKVTPRKLYIKKENQSLAFGKSQKDDFRKSNADGRGFQPLLYGVDSVTFDQSVSLVRVQVNFNDGRVREFLYAFEEDC